ncbi:hypothetical protein GGS20DRAFT_584302 [Poronia punctata]|nr:hypothetical protein GGS20DRAFT_584302 [Poronia punctata]
MPLALACFELSAKWSGHSFSFCPRRLAESASRQLTRCTFSSVKLDGATRSFTIARYGPGQIFQEGKYTGLSPAMASGGPVQISSTASNRRFLACWADKSRGLDDAYSLLQLRLVNDASATTDVEPASAWNCSECVLAGNSRSIVVDYMSSSFANDARKG